MFPIAIISIIFIVLAITSVIFIGSVNERKANIWVVLFVSSVVAIVECQIFFIINVLIN